ncbi:hypothetical protein O6H91_18G002400 [Diphasiastrum complanatum]|uniref:Uncharacterized protein n=1 Tax=Diphasiastrum complanatum TaxID=34168 RepID=A0ACC2AXJ3_DIPCM|nr:hypothetical protein O6H91_18G002400 [Diphasiastrum complanatum]
MKCFCFCSYVLPDASATPQNISKSSNACSAFLPKASKNREREAKGEDGLWPRKMNKLFSGKKNLIDEIFIIKNRSMAASRLWLVKCQMSANYWRDGKWQKRLDGKFQKRSMSTSIPKRDRLQN